MIRAGALVVGVAVMGVVGAAQADAPKKWGVSLAGGVSVFTNSQSFPHLMQPGVRLQAEYDAFERLRTGVELSGVLAPSGYRLIGGYVTVAGALYAGSTYRLEIVTGVGVGTAPPILSEDLDTEHGVTVWAQLGLRNRWSVTDSFVLGIDIVDEHLSVVTLTGAAGLRF